MNQKGLAQILILLGIVLLVAVVGGAFYVGKIVSTPPDIVPVITPTPSLPLPTSVITPTSTPVVDEITNWKTYTNSKIGIEFMYPPDYSIKYINDINVDLLVPYRPKGQVMDLPIQFLRKIIFPKENMKKCGEKEDIVQDLRSTNCYKDIMIGGVPGIKYARGWDNIIITEKPELQIIIDGAIIYRLSYGETVDQILASFKFLR